MTSTPWPPTVVMMGSSWKALVLDLVLAHLTAPASLEDGQELIQFAQVNKAKFINYETST